MSRVLTLGAALVGLVVGAASILGWLISGGWAVALLALPVAGLVLCVTMTVWAWQDWSRDKASAALAVFAWGFVIALAVGWGATGAVAALAIYGGLAAVGGVVASPWLVRSGVEWYKRQHKTCPDCHETVREHANVCRYCGFRWGPPDEEPWDDDTEALEHGWKKHCPRCLEVVHGHASVCRYCGFRW